MTRRLMLFSIAALALVLFACGDDDDEPDTVTTPTPVDVPLPTAAPTTGGTSEVPELGEEPIFWRTLDGFESLTAGEPYKVVLRVTNGYSDDTLPIAATPVDDGATITTDAMRVAPVDPAEKGTYYTATIELPSAGEWRLSASAGEDVIQLDVEAGEAS